MPDVINICAWIYLKLYQAAGMLIRRRMPAAVTALAGRSCGSNASSNFTQAHVNTAMANVIMTKPATTG